MKFRVERDALADAVAWTAKSLPTRPSVPVLGGVLLRVADGTLTVSGFDYEVSSQVDGRRAGRLRRRRAGLRPAARRDHQGAAGQAGRRRRGRQPPRARLRQRAVHAADHAGRGLPDPADDARARPARSTAPTFAAAVAQVAIAAGRDDTLPMLTGVRMELDGEHAVAARHRPLPAGGPRAAWRPDEDDMAAAGAGAGAHAGRHRQDARPARRRGHARAVPRRRRRGHDRLRRRPRRTTSRLLDAEFPKYRSLFPDQYNARPRTSASPALSEVGQAGRAGRRPRHPGAAELRRGQLVVEAGGSEEAPGRARRWRCEFTGEPLTIAFNPTYLLDGLAVLRRRPPSVISFTNADEARR